MTRQDWLLLVLAAADGKPLSPLQLQKSLFLGSVDISRSFPLSRESTSPCRSGGAIGGPARPNGVGGSAACPKCQHNLVGYDLARLLGSDFYTFRPFDYGPFDAAVYRDAWDAIGGDLRAALSSFEAAEPATHEAHSES